MTRIDWRSRLQTGDPALEGELDPAAAADMRRRVLEAVKRDAPQPWPFPRPLAMAATLALTIATGAAAGRLMTDGRPPAANQSVTLTPDAVADKRQLQFSTPGGTRIIWVFDPQFTIRETMP